METVEKERAQQEEAAKARAAQAGRGGLYADILRKIRRANDDIADPVLSAKIDRLEEIARKIFQAVEEDPQEGQPHRYLFELLSAYHPEAAGFLCGV